MEGCPGEQQGTERLTQVEYTTQKAALETVIQADHAAVVTQMKLFRSTEQVTEASIATIIGSTTGELNLWMEGKQESIQMERKYDRLIQRVLLNFGEFQTEKTGATAEEEGGTQRQEEAEETEVEEATVVEEEGGTPPLMANGETDPHCVTRENVEEATVGEADVTQRRTLRTQKADGEEEAAKQRALNVGRQLSSMDACMKACTMLQEQGRGGTVTERAQKELSERSEARKRGKRVQKADATTVRSGCGDAIKEAKTAWAAKMEEFMRRGIEEVQQLTGETTERFRERQARSCLPEEKHWNLLCMRRSYSRRRRGGMRRVCLPTICSTHRRNGADSIQG